MRAGVALALAMLAGCGGIPTEQQRITGPPGYRAGYNDGCPSGEAAAGHIYARHRKDVERALRDERYRMGWEDGFRSCKARHEGVQRMLGPVFR